MIRKSLYTLLLLFVGLAQTVLAQKVAIIDAGSSGSRLYIYEIDIDGKKKVNLLYPLNAEQKKQSRSRALSTIANNTDSVRAFLNDITVGYKCDSIDLYILATAGMRLKSKAHADSVYSKMLQQHEVNGYYVRSAMTISGQYEGLYGWIAANYDNGKLGFTKEGNQKVLKYIDKPFGILEIGGASLQLAFPTKISHPDCLYRKGINNIYCKSYLGAGVDQIYLNSKKYKFDFTFDDVSNMYSDNLSFWGLGIPVNLVIKGIGEQDKRNYNKRVKANIKSFKGFEDTMANYHPRMNAHYIPWVFKIMNIEENIYSPQYDSSWTIGAAIDIIINNISPEGFDHEIRK